MPNVAAVECIGVFSVLSLLSRMNAEREERALKKKVRKRVIELPEKQDEGESGTPVVYMPVGVEAMAAVHEEESRTMQRYNVSGESIEKIITVSIEIHQE